MGNVERIQELRGRIAADRGEIETARAAVRDLEARLQRLEDGQADERSRRVVYYTYISGERANLAKISSVETIKAASGIHAALSGVFNGTEAQNIDRAMDEIALALSRAIERVYIEIQQKRNSIRGLEEAVYAMQLEISLLE
jgi:hypothetical protein